MVDHLVGSDINSKRIAHIENCFGISGVPLSMPGRVLVGEGILTKICRKKPKPRQFFLFNDILVYGDIIIKKKKYVGQHIIPLEEVSLVDVPDDDDAKLKHGWQIKTPNKSFAVYAANASEKKEWIRHIDRSVHDLLARTGKEPTGVHAAVWVPDDDANVCMHCRVNYFSFLNRRHHCRYCGLVICGDCSRNKFLIPSQSFKPVRVCDSCNNILAKQRLGGLDSSPTSSPTGLIRSSDSDTRGNHSNNNSEPVLRAILHRSTLSRIDSESSDGSSNDDINDDPLTMMDDYLEDEKPTFYNDDDDEDKSTHPQE